jgi:hypothetical protein
MSALTRSVYVVIRLVSAPPSLRIDGFGPDLHLQPVGSSPPGTPPPPRSSSIRVVQEAASSSSSGVPHSELLGPECARFAAECLRRAALRMRTPGLACCVAGWSLPGARARSELVLAPCSMLARPVSKKMIELPFSHSSLVAVEKAGAQFDIHIFASHGLRVSPSSPVTQSENSYFVSDKSGGTCPSHPVWRFLFARREKDILVDTMDTCPLRIQDRRDGLLRWYKASDTFFFLEIYHNFLDTLRKFTGIFSSVL